MKARTRKPKKKEVVSHNPEVVLHKPEEQEYQQPNNSQKLDNFYNSQYMKNRTNSTNRRNYDQFKNDGFIKFTLHDNKSKNQIERIFAEYDNSMEMFNKAMEISRSVDGEFDGENPANIFHLELSAFISDTILSNLGIQTVNVRTNTFEIGNQHDAKILDFFSDDHGSKNTNLKRWKNDSNHDIIAIMNVHKKLMRSVIDKRGLSYDTFCSDMNIELIKGSHNIDTVFSTATGMQQKPELWANMCTIEQIVQGSIIIIDSSLFFKSNISFMTKDLPLMHCYCFRAKVDSRRGK